MATLPRTEHAVARRLASTADPRVALRRALGEIGESLGWPFGAVWETPPDRIEALRCTEVWHDGGPGRAEFEAHSRATTFAAGEGLPGRAWLTGTPTWIADVMEDDNFPRAEMAGRAGLLCAIAFPIRSARGVLGVIEFFSPETRRIDEDLLATVATLGDQIGQAVERRTDAEALRAKEARHVAMLHGALDAIVTIDMRGCILDFNAAAERTFGYTARGDDRRGDVRADRPARLPRPAPPRLRALPRDRGGARARPPPRAVGDALERRDLPGRADDHAHRRPRPADVHRLPARHHRPQGRRGRAARIARPHRRGRRQRAAQDRARPARRRAAAAGRDGARPAHGRGLARRRRLRDARADPDRDRRPARRDLRAARARPRHPPGGALRGWPRGPRSRAWSTAARSPRS